MPKYRNDSEDILVVDGNRVEVGKEVITYRTIIETGLTEISPHPKYNPILLAENYTGNSGDTTEVTIPFVSNDRELQKAKVNIFCKFGSADIAINDNQNTPREKISQGDTYQFIAVRNVATSFIINFNQNSSRVDVDITETS